MIDIDFENRANQQIRNWFKISIYIMRMVWIVCNFQIDKREKTTVFCVGRLDYAKIPFKGLEVKYYQIFEVIFKNNDHVVLCDFF